jgi:methionine-rich copper-binding protein CopC
LGIAAVLTFTESVIQSNYRTNTLYIIDLDEDGDADIISADTAYDEVVWYKNDGSESFTKTDIDGSFTDPQTVHPIDLDEDGDLDVVLAAANGGDKVVWYDNNGSESFTEKSIDASINGAVDLEVIDVDGDDDLDVVVMVFTLGDVLWYDNNGSESFTKTTIDSDCSGAWVVDAVDLDEDGDIDVVVGSSSDGVQWYNNDGSESFTEIDIDATFTSVQAVQVKDMDGDNDLDVVAISTSDQLSWFENDGSESFTENEIFTSGVDGPDDAFVDDLDGDGDNDIILVASNDDDVLWYENDGSGNFTKRTIDADQTNVGFLHVGDIDGDGIKDVVVGPKQSWSGDIAWYKSATDTTAPTLSSKTPADDATGIATNSNLTMTFNETIESTGTGYLTIYKGSDDSIVEQISAATGGVTGSGTTDLTINPSSDLDELTAYYVQVDSNFAPDASGNHYAGISDTTTWSFTTADETNPTASTLSPTDNATDVTATSNLEITFSETTGLTGTGYVTIYKTSGDSVVEQISTATGTVTGCGTTTVTIDPVADLDSSISYYIKIDAMAFYDANGRSYAGITDATTWNFTTAASGKGSARNRRSSLIKGRGVKRSQTNRNAGPKIKKVQNPTYKAYAKRVKEAQKFRFKKSSAPKATPPLNPGQEGSGLDQNPEASLPPSIVVTESSELSEESKKIMDRVCPRVERRFSGDAKMVDRVNKRLNKRFGFVCEV